MTPTPGRNRTFWERIRDAFTKRDHLLSPEEQDARRRAALEQERLERKYDDVRTNRRTEHRPFRP